KFTKRGGFIRLSVKRDGQDGIIAVKDTGIGIAPNMLSEVFEMFTQIDSSLERSRGGLGIGLTLVKRLVEMHGGNIEAKSDGLNLGSEFVIGLPLAVPATQEEQESGALPTTPRGRRILVVDDNVDAAMSLALMLELLGYETMSASDGVEALEVA